jgi:hypothetical protein
MTADPGAVGARDGFERMGGFPNFSSGGAVYRFSRRIGRGGMGEIYLGLQEGIGGLERLVVVKRIYAQLGEDERFSRLLVQEARLAATIQHPNVVQILDLGRDANGYFLVMEYLSGESVVFVARALRDRGERVPPAIACRLAADVAAGLHCAHTATDAAGRPQPIVHRDVTPSNLILCYNGVVKVVDFGVARANLPEGQTGAGIKGKLSYLAPEQIDNRPLDGRTDVFQLGICLHELLTGQRLFRGQNDHARVAAVLERPIPAPSEIVPSLPDSVDQVVLWALERDPAMRPESAEHFRLALEEVLARNGMVGPHDLAAWMKVTFADRLAQRTQFEHRCVEEMRARRSSDRLPAIDDSGVTPPPDPTGALHFVYDAAAADAVEPDGRSGTGSASIPVTVLTEPRRAWIAPGLAAIALVAITGSAIAWHLDRREAGAPPVAALAVAPPVTPAPPSPAAAPATRRSFDVAVVAVPGRAVIEIDDIEVGRGSYRVSLPMDGARHVLTVRADGYETLRVDFTDQAPPARVQLERIGGQRRALRARKTLRKTPRRRGPPRPLTDNPDPWRDDRGRAR